MLRSETVQSVVEQIRASAEHKLGVVNQSNIVGLFDNNTSAKDRTEYLEGLLRGSKKEELDKMCHQNLVSWPAIGLYNRFMEQWN